MTTQSYSRKMVVIVSVILLATVVGMMFIRDRGVNTNVTAETTRVGLVMAGVRDDANYCQIRYESLMNLKDDLNLQIICRENVTEDEACFDAMKELIEREGCRIIVAASAGYGEYVEKIAGIHPEVCFLHHNGTGRMANVSSCNGRMYQLRYLAGIVAGMRTETGEIGYVAAFPNSEVIRGLNAFTLGVRSVAPDACVHVTYCNSWIGDEEAREASERLLDTRPEIDVLSMHTNSLMPNYVAEERGIWSIGYNMDNGALFPNGYLTTVEWQWDEYYKRNILSFLQNKFYGKMDWIAIDEGRAGLSELTGNVTSGTKEAIDEALALFYNGNFDVFYGPVFDNEGTLRVPEDESMSDEEMLNHFDWYVEGVSVEK